MRNTLIIDCFAGGGGASVGIQCSIEGGFDAQKWAESIAELMEEKWRNEKHTDRP